MGEDLTEELLRRYLAGECTPEEEDRVNAWYQSLDGNSDVSGILHLLEDEGVEARIFGKVKSRLEDAPPHHEPVVIPITKARRPWGVLRYAAVILFLLIAGMGAFYFSGRGFIPVADDPISVVSNTENLIRRVSLPDGSLLWLYPNSAVEFPRAFDKNSRNLALRGEAFFVVARDETRPFIINASGVITTVLGTSFSIKAYEHEPSVEVEVMTGKVSVGLSDHVAQPVLLTSLQKATYLKGNTVVEKEEAARETENQLAMWQPADMSFDNASVGSVLQALNEKFRVRIKVTNSNVLKCMIRADFNDQNLPDILEMLSKSINATYKYEGTVFYLEGEGCSE